MAHSQMQYGVTPGRTNPHKGRRDWSQKGDFGPAKAQHAIDPDKYAPKRKLDRWPPELVQAAKALKIHPAELQKRLRVERGLQKLAAKFDH